MPDGRSLRRKESGSVKNVSPFDAVGIQEGGPARAANLVQTIAIFGVKKRAKCGRGHRLRPFFINSYWSEGMRAPVSAPGGEESASH